MDGGGEGAAFAGLWITRSCVRWQDPANPLEKWYHWYHTEGMGNETNPLGLDLINDVTGYATPHDVTDEDKAEEIAADMAEHGWRGAPLVVLRDYARTLTGVHRLAAAEQAGVPVPGVNAEELFEACGIDLWERREEIDGDLDEVLRVLVAELPEDVRDAYGLDIH